jgi:hypothetical protein
MPLRGPDACGWQDHHAVGCATVRHLTLEGCAAWVSLR